MRCGDATAEMWHLADPLRRRKALNICRYFAAAGAIAEAFTLKLGFFFGFIVFAWAFIVFAWTFAATPGVLFAFAGSGARVVSDASAK